MTQGEDGPEGSLCGMCDGAGYVVRCASCRDRISPVEADVNGGCCDSCRIDAETADGAAEALRIATRYA